ncbi:UDP-N-acetylenolpyruvoylglucosamine reductase [Brachybacterium ginsengisoli]|uniref:UDP-N-acetylenolpyruvoylglucosamine reductase n=1 Tax=Brachybacterium ginsengisoli TaxID=1331682 RepID=A0A291GVW8_9MICO|nr:UDP-N-acetylmuramate dehydrogenase [Brachybacterium ginsengisoli]ATG54365.1 UDP-N-acetylenolpyruvoylglucosamine reductase [Brachybacterium ginsengisoli]
MRLSDLTTLRIGGEIRNLVEARTADEVIAAVSAADAAGEPLLVLGGGSNLVASDEPFEGTVVLLRDPEDPPLLDATCEVGASGEPDGIPVDPAELTPLEPTCGGALVEYFAGVNWDRAVRYAVARGMVGIEALSGIPGSVGATPIQNVGAYGQEVAATISRVRTWDREQNAVRTFFAADCGFAYRDSVFKRTRYSGVPSATGRYVVLSVTFQHTIGSLSAPIRYAQLADALGVRVGDRAPMQQVRETVLSIRASKGMVLDPGDHDTWSAGSFFTNPILDAADAERLPAEAPRYDVGDDRVKTSAAWLISHSGIERGHAVGERAAVSTKHSLALTNRGGAGSDDLVALAHDVQARVQESFGIHLEPEPVRLGLAL